MVKRYTETTDSQMPAFMEEDKRGEYVRFDDVLPKLQKMHRRAQRAEAALARRSSE